MKKLKKLVPFLTALTLLFSSAACGGGTDSAGGSSSSSFQESSSSSGSSAEETDEGQKAVNEALAELSAEDFTYAQLMGTDSLGRKTMPVIGKEKKYVGIFYFVLLGQETHDTIYDITKLLETYGSSTTLPDGRKNPIFDLDDKTISPYSRAHYWGEPLYGYYKSTDKWVIRRHLELFMNAGIDFLYLDYTNNIIYEGATKVLLDAVSEMVEAGYENVPKVVPMLSYNPSWASWTFPNVYSAYFANEKYDKCWFRADEALNPSGKPLIIGNIAADSANADKFWIKNIQWPGQAFDEDAVPWMDWDLVQKNHNGVMTVTVAQGGSSSSEAYFDPDVHYQARGYTPFNPGAQGTDEKGVLEGSNFEFKWENAIKARDELDIVTVTGWNEWTVRKLTHPANTWDSSERTPAGSVISSSEVQSLKHLSPIQFTVDGRSIDRSSPHLRNASFSITSSPSGKAISPRWKQRRNTCSGSVASLWGRRISRRSRHPRNAAAPIISSDSGNETRCKCTHDANAWLATSTTPSGSATSRTASLLANAR